MRIESELFIYLTPFFFVVGTIYGFLVHWGEPGGFLAHYLTGGLSGMIGAYLALRPLYGKASRFTP